MRSLGPKRKLNFVFDAKSQVYTQTASACQTQVFSLLSQSVLLIDQESGSLRPATHSLDTFIAIHTPCSLLLMLKASEQLLTPRGD